MSSSTNKISEARILEILTKARHHELCRQLQEGMECLKAVWTDIKKKPDVTGYSPAVQAEILLRCGIFLSYYGHWKQIKECHEPALDWLTEAVDIFTSLGYAEKIAEAQLETGMVYWRTGQYREAESWLDVAATNTISPLETTSIKLLAMFLLVYHTSGRLEEKPEQFHKGYKLIEEKDTDVSLSGDSRVKVHYYLNSALINTELGKYAEAIKRYHLTIHYCREVGNKIYLATAENNIAFNYNEMNMFDKALEHVERAHQLGVEGKDEYVRAACYDTKALIYLKMENPEGALSLANKSIEIYKKGEKFDILAESYWTRILALTALDKSEETIKNFADLYHFCLQNINETSAIEYVNKFNKLVYLKKGLPLKNEVLRFEKQLIEFALKKCGGLVTPAASLLKISHQVLSKMLQNRHSDLISKLNVKIRNRQTAEFKLKKYSAPEKRTKAGKAEKPSGGDFITFANLKIRKPKKVKFNSVFQVSTTRLSYLGLLPGVLAVVSREIEPGKKYPVLIREIKTRQLHTGFPVHLEGLIGLEALYSEPLIFLPEDIERLGTIIGYLKPENNYYVFQDLWKQEEEKP